VKDEGGRRKAEGSPQLTRRALPFILHPSSFILAFFLGALTVLGFAPFSLFPLPLLTLSVLLWQWTRAAGARAAAFTGFAYGLGFFLCGVSWVYVSLHDFGAMPAPLAAVATLLFCAFLALFPALAGAIVAAVRVTASVELILVGPAAWTCVEWTRGWFLTGFPWLALGYSQVPASPLAGYAPVAGVYGITLATVASAGLIAVLWQSKDEGGRMKAEGAPLKPGFGFPFIPHPSSFILRMILHPSSFILVIIWLGGWGLQQIRWTQPVGKPVAVSLIQGNVPQNLKWQPQRVRATLDDYRRLSLSASTQLIILPETALPLFLEHVPRDYLEELGAHARRHGGDMLIGVPERQPGGHYYNTVVSIGASQTQFYRKSHLVPFGEFIPLRPLLAWIVSVLSIPLQDFSAGPLNPRPLEIAGQRVAVNICYEDAFGEEIIRQLPHATLLVNVSNVAWFGRSIAPQQHLQISQARALETGRYMLRATNTGMTAVVNPRGVVERQAPGFTRAVVTHAVQGLAGATPYVRWGNYAALTLAVIMLVAAFVIARRSR
jgi:apolipoprotein N-acyltransferase